MKYCHLSAKIVFNNFFKINVDNFYTSDKKKKKKKKEVKNNKWNSSNFFAQYSAFQMFAILVYYMIMFWFLHETMQTCKPTKLLLNNGFIFLFLAFEKVFNFFYIRLGLSFCFLLRIVECERLFSVGCRQSDSWNCKRDE